MEIADPNFLPKAEQISILGMSLKLPKSDAPAPILSMSSMIDQGKSLESYAESIGVKLPKADAASILGMSSMIDQGKPGILC